MGERTRGTRVSRGRSGRNSGVRLVKGYCDEHNVVLHPGRRGRGRGADRTADGGRHDAAADHAIRPVPRHLRPQVPQPGVPDDAWRPAGRWPSAPARERLGQGDLLLRISQRYESYAYLLLLLPTRGIYNAAAALCSRGVDVPGPPPKLTDRDDGRKGSRCR